MGSSKLTSLKEENPSRGEEIGKALEPKLAQPFVPLWCTVREMFYPSAEEFYLECENWVGKLPWSVFPCFPGAGGAVVP